MRFDLIKKWLLIMPLIAASLYLSTTEGIGSFDGTHSAAEEVSADSLQNMVRFLSVDPVTSTLRSRFSLREEALALVADSLSARLERYLGTTVLRLPFVFESEVHAPDSSFSNDNLVIRIEGDGSIAGSFYITAHYDAIGLRDAGWYDDWRTHPAP